MERHVERAGPDVRAPAVPGGRRVYRSAPTNERRKDHPDAANRRERRPAPGESARPAGERRPGAGEPDGTEGRRGDRERPARGPPRDQRAPGAGARSGAPARRPGRWLAAAAATRIVPLARPADPRQREHEQRRHERGERRRRPPGAVRAGGLRPRPARDRRGGGTESAARPGQGHRQASPPRPPARRIGRARPGRRRCGSASARRRRASARRPRIAGGACSSGAATAVTTTPGVVGRGRQRRRRARAAARRGCRAPAAAGAALGRCRGRAPGEGRAAGGAAAGGARPSRRARTAAVVRPYGIDAGQRLVGDERQRVQVRGRARPRAPRPAPAPCRPPCRSTSPVRVSESPPITRATPKSVSFAGCAAARRLVRNEDVGRLHVAVHDPVGVGVAERVAQRDRDRDDVAVRQPPGLEQRRRASRRGRARRRGRRRRRRPPPRRG